MIDVKGLTRAAVFGTFADSVPAQLSIPGGLRPIAVRVVGPDEQLVDVPTSGGFTVAERRTVFALRRDELTEGIPRNSTLTHLGTIWTVDGVAADDGTVVMVFVR